MKNAFLFILLALCFNACIGDDVIMDGVDPVLKITEQASSIAVGDTYQFKARFTNNVGVEESDRVDWSSSNEAILTIDATGLATAITQGDVTVTAEVMLESGIILKEEIALVVSMETIMVVDTVMSRTGVIKTTSSYVLEGDFSISEENDKIILSIAENYKASTSLPGLYVYLTNNPNTINEAFEIGKVEIFEGAHTYELEGIELTDYDYVLYYCKPFRVKVGDGKIN